MEFSVLRTLVDDKGWQKAVDELLVQKRSMDEKALIRPVLALQHWIEETLAYYKEKGDAIPALKRGPEELDDLFGKYIAL
jgi:hypothetical protein